MNNNVVGLDISKNVFHLYSQTADGKVVKKKLKRVELLAYIANMPVSLIGMEACGGAHYWAREFTKLGHEVVLLNARFVKGFVVGNKNDFNDAEAIFTAVTRPNKRVIAVKMKHSKIFKCYIAYVSNALISAPRWSIKCVVC